MCYSTGVTNELVQTLGLSYKTPLGLPGLKPSSNSVLPVAWITRPATDLRHTHKVGLLGKKISSKNLFIHNFMNKFWRYWSIVQEAKTESTSMWLVKKLSLVRKFWKWIFLTNHIVALSAYNLSFFIWWIETNSSLVGPFFYNKRLSVDHEKPSIIE